MLTDYEIAKQAKVRPIQDIAAKLGVDSADFMPYGDEVAKVNVFSVSAVVVGNCNGPIITQGSKL